MRSIMILIIIAILGYFAGIGLGWWVPPWTVPSQGEEALVEEQVVEMAPVDSGMPIESSRENKLY